VGDLVAAEEEEEGEESFDEAGAMEFQPTAAHHGGFGFGFVSPISVLVCISSLSWPSTSG